MPKIIGDSLAGHREHVRMRAFDALREQLYERGFDSITVAGVAARAGLGRSAMYNHFPDKESLLVAFVEAESDRYVDRLRAAIDAAGSPVEKLATFVRLQLRTLTEYHLPPGTALRSALAPATYRRIAAHADPITEILREVLAEGAAAAAMSPDDTDILVSMITSALGSRHVVDVPEDKLEHTIEAAVRFVLRAVGARPARGVEAEVRSRPARSVHSF